MSYVWGADVGGTTTRVGVADDHGTVMCVVTAGPGNPHTVGVATAAQRIKNTARAALDRAALDRAGPPTVTAGVIGLAGVTAVDTEQFAALADPESAGMGAGGGGSRVRVVADLAVAFASGTPAAEGIVALAGTGAGAMMIRDGETVDRRNAWGWLLGDEGSAQWIGREAIRHTLGRLEGRAGDAEGPLTGGVLERALTPDLAAQDRAGLDVSTVGVPELIRAVYGQAPTWLATLAPVVDDAARAGDPAAIAILAAAADHVVGFAAELARSRPTAPVVLAGSLLGANGPLAERVRSELSRWPNPVSGVTDGVAGACWLALGRAAQPADSVHRRLVETAAHAPRFRRSQ